MIDLAILKDKTSVGRVFHGQVFHQRTC